MSPAERHDFVATIRTWEHAKVGSDLPARLAFVEQQVITMRTLLAKAADEIERLANATANPIASTTSTKDGTQT